MRVGRAGVGWRSPLGGAGGEGEVGDFSEGAVAGEQVADGGGLVGDVLVNLGDAEVAGAAGHDRRLLAGDDGDEQAGLAQQDQALAVAHVEALELVAALREIEAAVGQHAVHVGDERAHGRPARTAGRAHAGTQASAETRSPATAKGSAMSAIATMSTSVSPKLYSKTPATRNVTSAASEPRTTARSSPSLAGSRRHTAPARWKKATKIQSHAASPTRPRSAAICSGVLCRWLVERRMPSGGTILG